MDIVASIKNDKAYTKSKLIVKAWEKEFKNKYSRIPSKFDIKEAPAKIKYAYKKYFQLKSKALENSLSICDNDGQEEEEAVSLEPEPYVCSSNIEISGPSDQALPAFPDGQQLEKLLCQSSKNNDKDNKVLHKFTENLSKKLFQNRKFSLRNPRKLSISKTQQCDEKSSCINNRDNIENISIECENVSTCKDPCVTLNMSSQNITQPVLNQIETMQSPKVRQLNIGWLERATGLQNENQIFHEQDNNDKFGISNIKIREPVKEDAGGNINDFVENSESEEEDLHKIKPALKKRKLNITTCDESKTNQENKNKNSNLDKLKATETDKKTRKTVGKLRSKSIIVDNIECQPPDIKEFLPFGVEKDILPRHQQVTSILKSIDSITTKNHYDVENNEAATRLENKIKSGVLNENFVKINIEKKVFVRGKKSFNFSKYKKQQWKNKKTLHASMEFPESGKISCFKCGEVGHMARYCRAHKGEALLPLENCNDNDIPTLEDMQKLVSQEVHEKKSITEQLSDVLYEPAKIPESFLQLLGDSENSSDIHPVYPSLDKVDSDELKKALQMFGHDSFRSGQENAIKRILSGMSTLLILSTGGGKSLCYQLPAYIYSKHQKCITLVMSPLVSLMEDQVLNMPEFLKAGCLHTNQSPTNRNKIIQLLKDGEINILLISPEALVSGDNINGFAKLLKSLPKIAFACIDEAHCVSHWSHNFRPSYLTICRVLREKLNVKCILGLTATASQTTIKSIISHINIPDGLNGVITNPTLPDNLLLSVSFEKDKDRALISYLTSEAINEFNSIIIYCIRRDECERVASVVRSCLQYTSKKNMEQPNRKRKRMSYLAEAYHAGMSAAQRKKIQKHFMDGTLRIIVATVAFGMGINKSDIRCIIHYNMPSSFESYVQEVGRAGRDGLPAYCHVFINNSNSDINELLKHIYSNSIDRPSLRKLLQKVFIPCECRKSEHFKSVETLFCKGHEVGIPIDSTVEELDIPSENIYTLLCYVELHPKQFIHVLNNAYIYCKISSYGGPQKILEAAKTCRPLAMAYLLEDKRNPDVLNNSILEFNVIEVAAAIGWESGITKYHLKNLEWLTKNGTSKRSFLKVEFNTLGFRVKARGDLSASELDTVLDDLHNTVLFQEKAKLYQLEECSKAFKSLGDFSIDNIPNNNVLLEKSNSLKMIIRNYFERENCLPENIELEERPIDVERTISDVRALIAMYKDCNFTGRSIAKIFQGISSPNYPAIVWGKCKFWRSHLHEDFNGLVKIATQQIIQLK